MAAIPSPSTPETPPPALLPSVSISSSDFTPSPPVSLASLPRTPRRRINGTPPSATRSSARLSIKNTRFPSFPPLDNIKPLFAPKLKNRAGARTLTDAEEVTYLGLTGTGREVARQATKTMLRRTIRPFIQPDMYQDFISMLDETGSGIAGSVARRMLAGNSVMMQQAIDDHDSRFLKSSDLNIVVPKGKLVEVKKWFVQHRYRFGIPGLRPARAYMASVRTYTYAFNTSQCGKKGAKITLSESVGNIMQVVLASTLTCQTNLITSTRVYAVYPTLVTNRDALRTDNTQATAPRRLKSSYRLQTSNIKWTGPCGVHCPSLSRRTVGDKGIASFHWNADFAIPESRYPDTDSLLAQNVLQWRFASRCSNPKCKRFETPKPDDYLYY
ncbi:hypothetical protein DFP72DRAFT_1068855 [Ephemerocybe angulata]|uniref:Uncharacterized protein n=1 Tax=Ephemerocybe angulata TaxID=980116 RepID=A0A8H6HVJ1_9AGAR|nr:hypothetical protein DFP72DRAFT_1068855 [Tulosesus angulatus]